MSYILCFSKYGILYRGGGNDASHFGKGQKLKFDTRNILKQMIILTDENLEKVF